jgi:peptidoglycan/xylan/chitin deacetylase (PgdA/CDA1 family)
MRLQHAAIFILVLVTAMPVFASGSCVVLQYHHFSTETPRITSVTPAEFQSHLDFLEREEFTVMPLDVVIKALKNNKKLPERCVSITVDDAYDSVYEEALPRLLQKGWSMSVFVNTRAIDEGVEAYLTWQQIREMAQHGIGIENHGHSHSHLVRLLENETQSEWKARVTRDIQKAQTRITQEVGRSPELFAYPYGEYSLDLKRIVLSLGLTGFGQQSGPISRDADFAVLPRFPMAADYAAMKGFKIKVKTLPLPVVKAVPEDPIVVLDEWRPILKLVLKPDSYTRSRLTCYANGSPDVEITWSTDESDSVEIRPNQRLNVGRNRYNCTMPSAQPGRYHWYSHTWIRRQPSGEWYREY